MNTEVSKTKMVAPKSTGEKLVSNTGTVRLEVQRPVRLVKEQDGEVLQPGAVVEVGFEEAQKLLKMSVEGQYDFSGERQEVAKKPRIHYFKLLREETDLDRLSAIQHP